MKVLVFLLSTLLCFVNGQHDVATDPSNCCLRLQNSTGHDSTCVPVRLTATQFQKSITTPNYPKAFAQDTFCIWEIRAMRGRRILIDFRNMHLAAHEDSECKSQKLIIYSPLTGMQIGPYCGYDGLPNIVSSGNYLVVELQSPYPVAGKQYKGFQMVYSETVQATSVGLRPPEWSNGMFLEYSTTSPSRTMKFRPGATRKNLPNTPPTRKPNVPKQKGPKERDRVTSNSKGPLPFIPAPDYYPPRVPKRIDDSEKQDEINTEMIVGIIVGGIIVVAIVGVVIAKISQRNSIKKQERAMVNDQQSQQVFNKVQRPTHLPAPYVAPMQYENQYVTHLHEQDRSRKRSPSKTKTNSSGKDRNERHRTNDRMKRPISEERKDRAKKTTKTNGSQRNRNEKQVKSSSRSKTRDHKSTERTSKNGDRANRHPSRPDERRRRKK